MRQYEMCEISWNIAETPAEWGLYAPEVTFTCGESVHKMKGFVAGDKLCKARFLPETPGTWEYSVAGCDVSGKLEVEAASEGNHGMVSAVGHHFEYQDGTYCYPFGTTIYALVHQSEELYEQTMKTLESAPFNKIRFCMFPKHYDYNHNEPRFYAFEKTDDKWDVKKPNFEYWNMVEDAILRLQKMGTECDLILFHPYDRWDFSKFSEEEDLTYLNYLLRRLSAMPNVWWSMSNEYDLVETKTIEHWEHIEEFLAEEDPYHHLIGNHNCFAFWDHSRKNITHASLQTKQLSRVGEWITKYDKPVCIDECCYEGNIIHAWGSISGKEMTYRFWRTVCLGGYCTHGETFYSDDEVLWWARGGSLKGESPERIAYLKSIVNELPGPIEPMPSGLNRMISATPEDLEKVKANNPGMYFFISAAARLGEVEGAMFKNAEDDYSGQVGDGEAFITFYNIRTCVKGSMRLLEDKKYRIEVIDVWNMTRKTIVEGVSGETEFDLPGFEGMAVLATKM